MKTTKAVLKKQFNDVLFQAVSLKREIAQKDTEYKTCLDKLRGLIQEVPLEVVNQLCVEYDVRWDRKISISVANKTLLPDDCSVSIQRTEKVTLTNKNKVYELLLDGESGDRTLFLERWSDPNKRAVLLARAKQLGLRITLSETLVERS